MRTFIKEEELTVPQGVFAAVASILISNEMEYAITEADDTEDEETITLTVTYEKSERSAFRDIQDLISDYEDEKEN